MSEPTMTVEAFTPVVPPRRRRVLRWLMGPLVLSLLAAVGITATVVLHKAKRPYLPEVQVYQWGPDEGPERDSHAGDSDEYAVASRPDARQTFYVVVVNHSHSTLTMSAQEPSQISPTGEDIHVAFAAEDAYHSDAPAESLNFRTSVTIPPDGTRWVRYTFRSRHCFRAGATESTNGIPVRVRSYGVTTNQEISFGSIWMGVYGTAKSCPNSG